MFLYIFAGLFLVIGAVSLIVSLVTSNYDNKRECRSTFRYAFIASLLLWYIGWIVS
ncbi:MAG: hypothetical protein IJ583_00570 [Firmicutes bacterium]|nr:hypothetical protein [Bacillota bacterium]